MRLNIAVLAAAAAFAVLGGPDALAKGPCGMETIEALTTALHASAPRPPRCCGARLCASLPELPFSIAEPDQAAERRIEVISSRPGLIELAYTDEFKVCVGAPSVETTKISIDHPSRPAIRRQPGSIELQLSDRIERKLCHAFKPLRETVVLRFRAEDGKTVDASSLAQDESYALVVDGALLDVLAVDSAGNIRPQNAKPLAR